MQVDGASSSCSGVLAQFCKDNLDIVAGTPNAAAGTYATFTPAQSLSGALPPA